MPFLYCLESLAFLAVQFVRGSYPFLPIPSQNQVCPCFRIWTSLPAD
jgi:hypothetical protein